jgi:hypothetical protein
LSRKHRPGRAEGSFAPNGDLSGPARLVNLGCRTFGNTSNAWKGRAKVSDSSQGPGWWRASDGKWYPPESGTGSSPPRRPLWPPAQPVVIKQGPGCMKIGLIVVGVLVLLGAGLAACIGLVANEAAEDLNEAVGEAALDDYELTTETCATDSMLGAQAEGQITNTSEKAQGFQITVRFELEDGSLLSEDPTFTHTINVGQSQQWAVSSLNDVPEGAAVTCTVARVEYTIFDNED